MGADVRGAAPELVCQQHAAGLRGDLAIPFTLPSVTFTLPRVTFTLPSTFVTLLGIIVECVTLPVETGTGVTT